MQRRSAVLHELEALLARQVASPTSEALVLQRQPLVRLLKTVLCHLHDHRRDVPAGQAAEHFEGISYWEAVLGWVKEQKGDDVILMNRERTP